MRPDPATAAEIENNIHATQERLINILIVSSHHESKRYHPLKPGNVRIISIRSQRLDPKEVSGLPGAWERLEGTGHLTR